MEPLECMVSSHVSIKSRASREIFLWKMKIELAGVRARKKKLIRAIRALEKELADAETVGGSDSLESEASKTLSHGRGTSIVTILVDVGGSEKSRTLSHGSGTNGDADCSEGSETRTLSHGWDSSEASSHSRITVDEPIPNIFGVQDAAANDGNIRYKR